jgi:hypothetical protein
MTMQDEVIATPTPPKRVPWNKGKLTGAKPPLRPKHVWSIRTKLQIEGRTRDLAMFNLAIDSKLRGCDVVAIRVEDVAASGYTADRATVRQKKTGSPRASVRSIGTWAHASTRNAPAGPSPSMCGTA